MKDGFTLWLTGLSGAGKSTLAVEVRNELVAQGYAVEILDGDAVRAHLSPELTFSKIDRDRHVSRLGYMALLLSRHGVITIVAAISPYRQARDEARSAHGASFVEVYVECPLPELIRRDPKGLYARALQGEIAHFTGVSDPYEPPLSPEIRIRTDTLTPRESGQQVLEGLEHYGLIARRVPSRALSDPGLV